MIGAIAVGIEIKVMIEARTVRLADLLLLFIYLEVLAMVAMYLDSGKLPVRMSLYIAIVTLAVLAHRYGHTTPPYRKDEEG
ncbi:MAG TPA: hypothetical protein ENJ01_06730 [Gammaproteobacteria bacterium]|nr:hypothetical protein [Gammaproteobacteria bacterium]